MSCMYWTNVCTEQATVQLLFILCNRLIMLSVWNNFTQNHWSFFLHISPHPQPHTLTHTHTHTHTPHTPHAHTHPTHTHTHKHTHTHTHPTHTQVEVEQERVLAEEWDRRRVVEAKAGLILESQEKKRQKVLAHKLAEENRQLAASQRARYIHNS